MSAVTGSLDRLAAALRQIGVPVWEQPAPTSDIEAFQRELAPLGLSLPEELVEFWSLVDVATMRVDVDPRFTTPAFSLSSFLSVRDDFPEGQPLALIHVGYESHSVMAVEADGPYGPGVGLFSFDVVDEPFTRCYDGLAGWLDHITELIWSGRYTRVENEGQPPAICVPELDSSGFGLAEATRPALSSHPRLGQAISLGRDFKHWPNAWRELAGLSEDDLKPLGRTHTIAEVLSSAGPVDARVEATVVGLCGGVGWTQVQAQDHTGRITINCSSSTAGADPRIHSRFEFDIRYDAGTVLESGPDLTAAFHLEEDARPIHAHARAVRPLQDS